MTQFYCLILVPETGEATPPQPLLDANEPWKARAEAASRYLKLRSQRDAIAGPSLLSDPAWDMLLDLFVGHITGRDVSVTSACLASRRPATTSLRYIERMAKQGLIRREKRFILIPDWEKLRSVAGFSELYLHLDQVAA